MKLKQIPEDFIVEEVIDLNLNKKSSDYSIWKLTKREWESFKIINALAKALKTKTRFIGFAGNKDRNAVTTQCISIYKIPKEKIEKIKINGAKLEFLGYSVNRINLGDLKGNNFKVVVRDLDKKIKIPNSLKLENYFDEQRFGNKFNTHLVGKAILKRDFKLACGLLNLEVKNNDCIGAIKQQQIRLLRFYISSYQSYLWNKTLSKILKKEKKIHKFDISIDELVFTTSKIRNFRIPIINFDIEKNKVIDNIMNEEEIKREDFRIKEIPELVTESKYRDAFIDVKNIKCYWDDDELNEGRFKVELKFFLPKGSYATMLIKKLSVEYNNFVLNA